MPHATISSISGFQLAWLHWKVQALANILFGFSMVGALLRFLDFSWETVARVGALYFGVYVIIFVPLFGMLPVIFFRKAMHTLAMLAKGMRVSEDEGLRAIEALVNRPTAVSLTIFFLAFLGFGLGIEILQTGIFPEVMPLIHLITYASFSIGFVVSGVHGFLNLIFLESFLHPFVQALTRRFPSATKGKLNIVRHPFFMKVLMIALFSMGAGMVSLLSIFLSKIAFSYPFALRESLLYSFVVMALNVVLILVIVARFSRNMTKPLQALDSWSFEIIKGKLDQKTHIVTNDEIFDLVRNLNHMADELRQARAALEVKVQERTKDLKELADSLELQVRKRTKELQEKINELERFQKLAVGRELKMVELKKNIATLERPAAKQKKNIHV